MATLIDYPAGMPGVLISSDSNSDAARYQRNDVQIGPPVYELLTTTGPSFFKVVWSYSEFEFQVFEGWFKSIILYGSKSFNMDLIVGAGLLSHECFFDPKSNAPYTRTRVGKRFKVSANILAVAKQYDTDDMIDSLLALQASVDGDAESWVDAYSNLIENVLQPAFPA
jgi:hypothetical protein